MKFNILIVFAALALFFAIAAQYVWAEKTYEILKNNQESLINLSITRAADDFSRHLSEVHKVSNDTLDFTSYKDSSNIAKTYFASFIVKKVLL